MKMKKLLAALLAVCMLLTMLPVAAFAAGVDHDIVITEQGDLKVDGVLIETEEDAIKLGYGVAWFYEPGLIALMKGSFSVTSDILLEMLVVDVNATLVGGNVNACLAANVGTISGGNITLKEPDYEYEAYSIDFAPGSFFNFGTISDKTNIDCIAFQNGGEMNFGPAPSMMSADTMESSAVINGAKIDAEYAVYNYGIISNSTIDCQYFQNGYYSSYQPMLAGEDEESAKYIFSNSKLNALDIYNEAGAVFERIDCGDCSVHTQFYDQMLGNQQAGEYPYYGTLTWDTVKCDSLSMSANNGNGQTYAEWEVTSADALTDTKWQWPSKAWFDSLELVTAAEPVNNQYIYFTVPSGYKLSIVENDFVLHKEVPKPPVIEEEIEKETYDIVVRVKFDGVDEDEIDFVNAQLLKNGKAYKKAVKVDAKDEWRHEWVDVDDSSKIEWTVTADEIEGYNMEIENVRANYWTITLSAKDVVAEKANPETGAADFVGAAVAMAVVSVAAAGALALKKIINC